MATTRKSRRLSSRWSQERELAFLEHLALSSNVAASERVAKLTPGTAYRQRRKVGLSPRGPLDRADRRGRRRHRCAHHRRRTRHALSAEPSRDAGGRSHAQSDGFDVDTLDVDGALTHDAITADDLAAGRWDGAALTLFAADWSDPAGDTLVIARGEIGDVSIRDEAFTAELRGPTALLERPVVEQTSPDCRAALGDRRCRVDLAARTRFARVVAVADEVLTLDAAEPSADAYGYGRLRWLDGADAALAAPILSSAGTTVTLRDPPAFPIEPGVLIELREGCDRLLSTCRTRFANAANFRGEPYLPGIDLLTRYGTD